MRVVLLTLFCLVGAVVSSEDKRVRGAMTMEEGGSVQRRLQEPMGMDKGSKQGGGGGSPPSGTTYIPPTPSPLPAGSTQVKTPSGITITIIPPPPTA